MFDDGYTTSYNTVPRDDYPCVIIAAHEKYATKLSKNGVIYGGTGVTGTTTNCGEILCIGARNSIDYFGKMTAQLLIIVPAALDSTLIKLLSAFPYAPFVGFNSLRT